MAERRLETIDVQILLYVNDKPQLIDEAPTVKDGDKIGFRVITFKPVEGVAQRVPFVNGELLKDMERYETFRTNQDGIWDLAEPITIEILEGVLPSEWRARTEGTAVRPQEISNIVTYSFAPLEAPIEEEVVVEEPVKILELPALPENVAWLEPVLRFMGVLTESSNNWAIPTLDKVMAIPKALEGLGISVVDGYVNGFERIFGKQQETAISNVLSLIKGQVDDKGGWQGEFKDALDPISDALLKPILDSFRTVEKEDLEERGEEAVNKLNAIRNAVLIGAVLNFILHALIETGSLGQFEFMKDFDPMVTSKLGIWELMQRVTMLPLEKGLFASAEYEYNRRHTPYIPPYTDLINMRVKEKISAKDFDLYLSLQGFSNKWASLIWDSHFIPPNLTEILNAYYRGVVKKEELPALMERVDLDPEFNPIFEAQIEVIPPYQELVNQRVKEVLTEEEFTKYLKWYGFDEAWAKKIWDAHFLPPSLNDILTAWRRDEISEEDVDKLSILIDLDPRYKEIFDTRKYIDPSVTQARFMFETGAIDEAGVKDIIHRNGFNEADTQILTNFIVGFQERIWRRRYLIALQGGVVSGNISPDELKKEVLEANYTEGVAEWMVKTAEVRQRRMRERPEEVKARILTVTDLRRAYLRGKISEDVFRTELNLRGYTQSDIDILIDLLSEDLVATEVGAKQKALSVNQLLNAFRYDVVKEDYLRQELLLRGLSTDEVNIMISTKKKQWGLVE